MKGGRKNLKRSVADEMETLQEGQSIMQVVDLRGSNLIEVMDLKGEKLIAIFPAKFQKSMWIRQGNFVVVDESGREEAVKSGRKVAGIVTQVLYHEQVRQLKKSSEWPEVFRSTSHDSTKQDSHSYASQQDDEGSNDDDDDGLPPLEANTNRLNALILRLDTESESNSDSDS